MCPLLSLLDLTDRHRADLEATRQLGAAHATSQKALDLFCLGLIELGPTVARSGIGLVAAHVRVVLKLSAPPQIAGAIVGADIIVVEHLQSFRARSVKRRADDDVNLHPMLLAVTIETDHQVVAMSRGLL